MPFNWRKLPHPTYGNYGGRKNKGKINNLPIDWMDEAFKFHDSDLNLAKNKDQIKKADKVLLKKLKKGSNKELKYPIYGRIYRLGSILIFSLVT